MKKRGIILGLVFGMCVSAFADLRLHELFTDNMVLQRNRKVPVWGMADPGMEIAVEFAGQRKSAVAGSNGTWSVLLDPMAVSLTPQTLTVSSPASGCSLQVSNVLVGDVWLCGGQSNMDHPFSSYSLLKDSVKTIDCPAIRLLALAHESGKRRDQPLFDASFTKGWQECRGPALSAFSPVGYYFGNVIHTELNVPVGLVESAWGGTRIEPWMTLDPEGGSGRLYNAMIHPLKDFAFKGVIWYQGESNAREPVEYAGLFADMIRQWRAAFGQPDMPFYFVQLAPFKTLDWNKEGAAWAWLRESQVQALKLPNTGMAVITDLGEFNDIHPQSKQPVGERLARFVLKSEGRDIETDGPVFGKMDIQKQRCVLQFSHTGKGLLTKRVVMNKNPKFPVGEDAEAFVAEADVLRGFSICGEDQQFVPARARITGADRVEVWHPDVECPVAVRYGWDNFPLCNLFNSEGLPASPFRTDTFPPPEFDGALTGSPFAGDVSGFGTPAEFQAAPDESTMELRETDGRPAHWFGPAEKSGSVMAYWRGTDNSLRDGKTPEQVMTVVYFDQGKGRVELLYDSSDKTFRKTANLPPGVWKAGGTFKLTNTGTWRAAEFRLNDAMFSGRCNGQDFRFESASGFILSGVYLRSAK